MKKQLYTFLILCAFNFTGKAQANLDIPFISNLPDTVYLNEIRNVSAVVKNFGDTPFSGLIYFDVKVDSLFGTAPFLARIDSVYANLSSFASDSIEAIYQVPITTATGFKVGGNGNTVVIWPRAKNTAIPNDSIVVSVYVKESQVGIRELSLSNKKINIYPNPTTTILNFWGENITEIKRYKLFDFTGKEIREEEFNKTINVSSLQNGLYTIILLDHSNKILSIKKVIKQ